MPVESADAIFNCFSQAMPVETKPKLVLGAQSNGSIKCSCVVQGHAQQLIFRGQLFNIDFVHMFQVLVCFTLHPQYNGLLVVYSACSSPLIDPDSTSFNVQKLQHTQCVPKANFHSRHPHFKCCSVCTGKKALSLHHNFLIDFDAENSCQSAFSWATLGLYNTVTAYHQNHHHDCRSYSLLC